MYKEIFLRLLEDDDVQRKILSLVKAEPREDSQPREEIYRLKKEAARSEQKIRELQSEIENWKSRARDLERRSEEFRRQSEESARRLEEARRQFQRELAERAAAYDRLERDKSSLQETLRRVREQSAQRFERGWELFQSYQRVSAHARQILNTGVFHRDNDFTSFICGGAQVESLKMLWDEIKECVMSRRRDDAAILWDVFEYCVELVNASKSQAIFSILPTREGDRFDSDVHEEGPDSRAQGKIVGVYLKGYKNNYDGKIVRKSIVQVG